MLGSGGLKNVGVVQFGRVWEFSILGVDRLGTGNPKVEGWWHTAEHHYQAISFQTLCGPVC